LFWKSLTAEAWQSTKADQSFASDPLAQNQLLAAVYFLVSILRTSGLTELGSILSASAIYFRALSVWVKYEYAAVNCPNAFALFGSRRTAIFRVRNSFV
jgi:hypothetical protein